MQLQPLTLLVLRAVRKNKETRKIDQQQNQHGMGYNIIPKCLTTSTAMLTMLLLGHRATAGAEEETRDRAAGGRRRRSTAGAKGRQQQYPPHNIMCPGARQCFSARKSGKETKLLLFGLESFRPLSKFTFFYLFSSETIVAQVL